MQRTGDSITISSNSIRVFLKISFTIRHRLMPEIACSTMILELEIARFKRLSPIESAPFRGFFWVGREFVLLFITNGFVVMRSFVCLTQILNPLCLITHDNDVIIGMRLLFPAV